MQTEEAKRVAVLGPGGVGGLLAALLARAGHHVTCLAGEETARTLRRDGIRVTSGRYGEFTAPLEAATRLREPVDLCLVGVKHTALEAALGRIPGDVLGDALLVPLLNGLEHPALLRAHHRPELVAPSAIRVESTRTAPGVIVHGSPFAEVTLAGDTVARERLHAVEALLTSVGVGATVEASEAEALWQKMYFLAPAALLTTRHRVPLGEVRTTHRAELVDLIRETVSVGRAAGASGDATAVLRRYDDFPATTKSSMLRDAEAGRPLELDAIGGALLRAAASHRVPAPVAGRLLAEIEERESVNPSP